MTVEATRLDELRKLLTNNGFEHMIKSQDGCLAKVNIWIGEKDAVRS